MIHVDNAPLIHSIRWPLFASFGPSPGSGPCYHSNKTFLQLLWQSKIDLSKVLTDNSYLVMFVQQMMRLYWLVTCNGRNWDVTVACRGVWRRQAGPLVQGIVDWLPFPHQHTLPVIEFWYIYPTLTAPSEQYRSQDSTFHFSWLTIVHIRSVCYISSTYEPLKQVGMGPQWSQYVYDTLSSIIP